MPYLPPALAACDLNTYTFIGQTTTTLYASKAAFVSTRYSSNHFDATLEGSSSGSASDGTGAFWGCNQACNSNYCPNLVLGYEGTTASWYSVATFQVVVWLSSCIGWALC